TEYGVGSKATWKLFEGLGRKKELGSIADSVSSHIPQLSILAGDKWETSLIKYRFGIRIWSNPLLSHFCGHPDFARYIKCTSGELRFSSGTGAYTVSSIDYTTSTLVLTDMFMSTCSSMQNSGSFRLDRAGPFTLSSQDMFVFYLDALGRHRFLTRMRIYVNGLGWLLCILCRGVYSCEGVVLGWTYRNYNARLMLQSMDLNCEASGGFCGFAGFKQSFSCICRGGGNSTTNCYGRGYAWNGTWKHKIQTKIILGDIKNYDIVFHIGDICYANGYLSQWDQFTEQVEPIASAVPYMVASGNHERDWPNSGSFYENNDSGGECGVLAETMFYVVLRTGQNFG
ncbi:wall-associated receptor kinase, galacturonan-binding domain-containing protein, partial [Tanacetum coccineum]